jgi:hypothetical protein
MSDASDGSDHASPVRPMTAGMAEATTVHAERESGRSKRCSVPVVVDQSGAVKTTSCSARSSGLCTGASVGEVEVAGPDRVPVACEQAPNAVASAYPLIANRRNRMRQA